MSFSWDLAGSVILTGLVLVFAILLILILIVQLTSRLVGSGETGGKAQVKEMAAVIAAPKAQNMPVIQAGIEEETVAAIMAAISCMTDSDSGARYAVRSISRVKGERPVWASAGMQQNTRPF